VVSADNLSSGIASAAFIAYLSSLTNINYSATQYALFSSMMLLAAQVAGGFFGGVRGCPRLCQLSSPARQCWVCQCLLLVWLASRAKSSPAPR
jgi:PAT family beta-lactamase induction signal transducer AmpG